MSMIFRLELSFAMGVITIFSEGAVPALDVEATHHSLVLAWVRCGHFGCLLGLS